MTQGKLRVGWYFIVVIGIQLGGQVCMIDANWGPDSIAIVTGKLKQEGRDVVMILFDVVYIIWIAMVQWVINALDTQDVIDGPWIVLWLRGVDWSLYIRE